MSSQARPPADNRVVWAGSCISGTGTGVVIAQEPKANEEVQEGTVITVRLQEAVNANTQN